jgi:hypothetical protein
MTRNLMVCANSKNPMRIINESAEPNKDIYLEGIFAELDVKNRNNRIYTKEEYLKHLDYLRADIREGQSLLGELDHPEDRFEVKIKEASHQIVDIWYDSKTNCVMGKIKLLRTPNGLLAQSILEQGIPLHISSRAAGTVNSDNTVKIQQIYTYDLVCKPGFAKAVLHVVNESENANVYSNEAKTFMMESESTYDRNIADAFGIESESILISEMQHPANFRQEALAIQQLNFDNDMIKENNTEINPNESNVCPDCGGTGNVSCDGSPCKKCHGHGNIDINEDGSEENSEDKEKSSDENDKNETDDKGVEIIAVNAITSDDEDGVDIKGVESVVSDEDSQDSDENDEEKSDEFDENESDENTSNEEEESDASFSDATEDKKCPDKKDMLLDCDDIKKRKDKFEDTFADLVDAIKRKSKTKAKNESLVVSKYPMAALLNEDMYADFMSMSETQKSNVMLYINENNINPYFMDVKLWESAKNYTPVQEVWLKYAPDNYKMLFESADELTKQSIRYTAQYLLFENQHDINNFWRNTGLKEKHETMILNEQFINNMPKIENVNESNSLGYSKEFVNMIAEMACAYNN